MGGTWKPKLLYHLQHGLRRVGDFKQLVEGISENVLIQQLRELQTVDGVVRHG
ncbi:winged helix-turn-helix transcriptional regulator [Luteimonas cellulosilyticus]|uniref:winged helix-turn-helix transcriptional regulator n=1 Tax=Luteimonas cellulosilyticus TaxID=2683586 RepID=UPI001916A12B